MKTRRLHRAISTLVLVNSLGGLGRASSVLAAAPDPIARAETIARGYRDLGYPLASLPTYLEGLQKIDPTLTPAMIQLVEAMVPVIAPAAPGQPPVAPAVAVAPVGPVVVTGPAVAAAPSAPANANSADPAPANAAGIAEGKAKPAAPAGTTSWTMKWTVPTDLTYTAATAPNLTESEFAPATLGLPSGQSPTGTVTFTAINKGNPAGVVIATVDLTNGGKVQLNTKPLNPGDSVVLVEYSGDKTYAASSIRAVVTVADKSEEAAFERGLKELHTYPIARRIYYAQTYGYMRNPGATWQQFSGEAPDTKVVNPSSQYDPEFASFCTKFGNYTPKKTAALAATTDTTGSGTTARAGSVTAQPGNSGASNATAGAQKAENVGGTTSATTITERLRDYGISFAPGIGAVVSSHGGAGIGTLLVRWNWLQEQSTIKWNKYVSEGKAYQKIPYFGKAGWDLVQDYVPDPDNPNITGGQISEILDYHWSNPVLAVFHPNTFGPFLGGGATGNTVAFGHNPDGTVNKQRPYLLGISAGWGRYDGAASTVYVDVGATISPTTGFAYSKPYIGLSLDAALFGSVLDYIRNSKPAPSDPPAGSDASNSGK